MPSGYTDDGFYHEAPQRIYYRKQEFKPLAPSDVFSFALKPGYRADIRIWGTLSAEEQAVGFSAWTGPGIPDDVPYIYGDQPSTFVAYSQASHSLTACHTGRDYDLGHFKLPAVDLTGQDETNPYGVYGDPTYINYYAPQNYCPTDGSYSGSLLPWWALMGNIKAIQRMLNFWALPAAGPFQFSNAAGVGSITAPYGGLITLARINIFQVPDNNTLEVGNPAVYRAGHCSFGRV